MLKNFVVSSSAFLLLACGGSSASPAGDGTSTGTVAGAPFDVASVVLLEGPASSGGACSSSPDGGSSCVTSESGQAFLVVLSSRPEVTCSAVQATQSLDLDLAGIQILELEIVDNGGSLPEKTYDVGGTDPDASLAASFATLSASCAPALHVQATRGSVTLTSMTPSHVAGTYSLGFGSQGQFSGHFDTTICTLPAGVQLGGSGDSTCRP